MKKNFPALWATLFLVAILGWMYYTMMPRVVSEPTDLNEFSTEKALQHIRSMTQQPHYVGSDNHETVAGYLVQELKNLGLNPQIQEGTTLTEWGNLVKSKNIIARIKGTHSTKALLLLSHYDSAPHSFSRGASDDASGVATILEGIRAFLHEKSHHKNDIIILFSDAEELGLNGAALFVTEHQWAKEVGLAINFEARGSAGPSYMLMEVNHGNAALVEGFSTANPRYPVSNSLMYSIYKMLPNDTDLTVFREQGKIQGFNFAFIDNHFDYHTAQDDLAHLNPHTLAHQGSYLMPLLRYFSNADLRQLNTKEDKVYFNTPINFISYPFDWIVPMVVGALVLFLFLLVVGFGKKILHGKEIGKGFLYLFGAILTAAVCNYFGWQLLLKIYPQYTDILQGFTYNGHYYLAAFGFLNLAIGFLFYGHAKSAAMNLNRMIAPLSLWILIGFGIAFYLPGAAFFVIPIYFCLLMLAYFVVTQRTNLGVNLILSIPALVIFVPFITQFPIGLGLKMLAASAVLTLLVFALLVPIFGSFAPKRIWVTLLLALSVTFLTFAHFNSDYESGKAKPNSLVYWFNADANQAFWATYDEHLDDFTRQYLGKNPAVATTLQKNQLFSKYDSQFTYMSKAPMKSIAKPTIEFLKDSVVGSWRYLRIKISPNRKVNRYDIFADEKMAIHNLRANHAKAIGQQGTLYPRTSQRVFSYYVVGNQALELEFCIASQAVLDMSLVESSFDLMQNPNFAMTQRASWMMPKPFVLTDAVCLQQRIKPSEKPKPEIMIVPAIGLQNDSIVPVMDTIKIK